jgi:hypothetical protein
VYKYQTSVRGEELEEQMAEVPLSSDEVYPIIMTPFKSLGSEYHWVTNHDSMLCLFSKSPGTEDELVAAQVQIDFFVIRSLKLEQVLHQEPQVIHRDICTTNSPHVF